MHLNPIIQHENHSILCCKLSKVQEKTGFPMFRVAFPCKKHGIKHVNYVRKHVKRWSCKFLLTFQYITTCRINVYLLVKTWFLTCFTHVFSKKNTGTCTKYRNIQSNTHAKERKHRNEHG